MMVVMMWRMRVGGRHGGGDVAIGAFEIAHELGFFGKKTRRVTFLETGFAQLLAGQRQNPADAILVQGHGAVVVCHLRGRRKATFDNLDENIEHGRDEKQTKSINIWVG